MWVLGAYLRAYLICVVMGVVMIESGKERVSNVVRFCLRGIRAVVREKEVVRLFSMLLGVFLGIFEGRV